MRAIDRRKELIDIYGISEILKAQEPEKAQANEPAPGNPADWDGLRSALKDCRRCRLSEARSNVVFGEGNINAELMFIGEGPGEDEDSTGRPFVGRAGQLLTKMIEAMKYKREEVYIANVVKCRPPGNREPFKDEVDACIGFLNTQIDLIRPKVIICLGSTSAEHLLKLGLRISQIRGKFQDYHGIKVMPTFHPAFLLRNETRKKDVWSDLKLVMAELGKI